MQMIINAIQVLNAVVANPSITTSVREQSLKKISELIESID